MPNRKPTIIEFKKETGKSRKVLLPNERLRIEGPIVTIYKIEEMKVVPKKSSMFAKEEQQQMGKFYPCISFPLDQIDWIDHGYVVPVGARPTGEQKSE